MKRLKFFPQDWQVKALLDGSCSLLVWPVKQQTKFTIHKVPRKVVDDSILVPPCLYFDWDRPHEKGNKIWIAEEWRQWPNDDWRPAITMPKWASRIHLEILDIACKRVREMYSSEHLETGIVQGEPTGGMAINDQAREAFKSYWLSRYGEGSWDWYAWVMKVERVDN